MNVHPETPRVHAWIRERQGEMVRFLERLARIESPSTDPAAQGAVFTLMQKALEEVGWEVRRLPGVRTGGHLYARPAGRRRRRGRENGAPVQLIVGHVDTVWPAGTLEEMPVVENDGTLRGPGVFDMKGGLAQLVFALRALAALDVEPRVTPVVFLNSDEEIGSPESEVWVRRLARASSRALVLEPALEPVGRLKTTRRGGGRFEVRVTGRSAHTGLAPEEGASAIHELSHVIQTLYQLSDPERDISVNVGEIRGGSRPNVVAPEASAVVDVRVRTQEDGRWIEERIRELETVEPNTPGTSVRIRGGVDRPPMEATPRNRALWHAAREVGEALGLDLEEGMSGGGSDGNTTSLFTATLDGLGPVGDGAHALHEYVDLDRMPERAALLGGILLLPEVTGEEETGAGASGRTAGGAWASDQGSTGAGRTVRSPDRVR
jgi:glutamate carboxypeptidase